MSPTAKKILGSVLSAAVTAGVAFLAPVLSALHIPRPGDVKASDVEIK